MNTAFQVVVITDRRTDDGRSEVWLYAARTQTAEQALALAKERLTPGWTITVTPGFLYAPTVVAEHGIGENEIVRISTISAT
jgi:hypothetical protein